MSGGRLPSVTVGLFLSLFAAQAAVIVLSPVLVEVASDLDVSTAAAGQLRTITGLVAGVTALGVGAVGGRVSLRRQLLAATALLALGSIASALAGSYVVLALAQVPVGAAVAVLTTAAVVAAAEWSAPEQRTAVLSWTLTGQPAAWIVGMPILGLVGDRSWRLGWLVLPLAAAVAAAIFIRRARPVVAAPVAPAAARTALAEGSTRRWLLSELLVNAGWAGTLVYSGALFTQTYDLPAHVTGLLLAAAASAYVGGNLLGRRLARDPSSARLAALALGLAVALAAFGLVRTSAAVSVAAFAVAAALAGARTLVASAFGLAVAPGLRATLAGLRAATMQFGYFLGSLVGGLALGARGYGAVEVAMSMLAIAAACALVVRITPARRVGATPLRARAGSA
jgi:predicted MFS family arabinose efflux permease